MPSGQKYLLPGQKVSKIILHGQKISRNISLRQKYLKICIMEECHPCICLVPTQVKHLRDDIPGIKIRLPATKRDRRRVVNYGG